MQLALKDPERLAAVMTPISQMLVELLKAAVATGAIRVAETRRAAMLIQQTVMYGWLMNRFVQNPRAASRPRTPGSSASTVSAADAERNSFDRCPSSGDGRPDACRTHDDGRGRRSIIHEEPRDRRSSPHADRPRPQGVAGDQGRVPARRGGGPSRPRATKIDPKEIDDVVIAESLQGGGVIARHTAVVLGLESVPGLATNRHCAAGLGAIAIGSRIDRGRHGSRRPRGVEPRA